MTDDWPSGLNEDQIFSTDENEEAPLAFPVDADGAILENLYCLTCGYNLRGLTGDPIRCPECGGWNELGIVRIPAQHIEIALRQLETAPTHSVALSLPCVGSLTLAVLVPPGRIAFLVVAAVLAIAWAFAIRRMRIEFDNQQGWQSVLFRFHLAACLWVLEATFVVRANVHLLEHGIGLGDYAPILPAIAGLPLIVIALRIYKPARASVRDMQRDRAIVIARKLVQGRLGKMRR